MGFFTKDNWDRMTDSYQEGNYYEAIEYGKRHLMENQDALNHCTTNIYICECYKALEDYISAKRYLDIVDSSFERDYKLISNTDRKAIPVQIALRHLDFIVEGIDAEYHWNMVYKYCERTIKDYASRSDSNHFEAYGKAYFYLSFKYSDNKNYRKAIELVNDAIYFFENCSDESGMLQACISRKSFICLTTGDLEMGRKLYKMLDIDLNDEFILHIKCLIHFMKKEYTDIESFISKYNINNSIDISKESSRIHYLLLVVYWSQRDKDKFNKLCNLIKCSTKLDDLIFYLDNFITYHKVDIGIIEEVKRIYSISSLDTLVGLDNVKKQINEILSFIKVKKMRKDMGIETESIALHMLFYGPPGTGKTSVARSIALEYKRLGVISKGHLVEVDRKDLVAGYVGQTAIKTNEVIKSAKGGVLFIDEAYSLISETMSDYGKEALDTIVKAMEDYRDDLVVIMAGYEKEMQNLLLKNTGLKSRIPFIIKFENYDQNSLYEIALKLVNEKNYMLNDGAKARLKEVIKKLRNEEGSARLVRNIVEKIILNQSLRVSNLNNIKKEDLLTITEYDLSSL